MSIDHYAEAEGCLATADLCPRGSEDERTSLAYAQVHATLATVQRDQPWIPPWVPNLGDEGLTSRDPDEQAAIPDDEADRFLDAMQGVRTIPWPPSEELEGKVAEVLHQASRNEPGGCVAEDIFGCPYIGDHHQTARAVLDAIRGDQS